MPPRAAPADRVAGTEGDDGRPGGGPGRRGGQQAARDWWFRLRWSPLLGLAVYLVGLGQAAGRLTSDVYWNSDVATPLVVGDGLARGVVHPRIGIQQAAYTWAAAVTRQLPGWQTLWRWLPLISMLLSLAVLALAVRRSFGGWVAMVTLAMAASAPPLLLLDEVAPVFHGLAMALTLLLDALLLALCRGALLPWRVRTLVACVVMAALAGVVAATDVMLVVTGLLPLALAGLLLAWQRRSAATRRVAVATVSICGGAALVAAAVQGLMHRAGYSTGLPPASGATVSLSAIGTHLRVLVRGLTDLGDGLPTDSGGGINPFMVLVAVVLVLLGCVAVVVAVIGATRRPSGIGATHEPGGDVTADVRGAHCAYWAASAALLLGSFVVANVVLGAGGDTPPSARLVSPERYLSPLWFALAALAPLAAPTVRRQTVTGLVATAWCILSAAAVGSAAQVHTFRPANTLGLEDVVSVLQQHGVIHGYASYWDAYALTVQSGFAVTALPAAEGPWCGSAGTATCAHIDNGTISWYTPRSGPSFVLIDPQVDYLRDPPPPSLGVPSAVVSVGHFTVYEFPDDVLGRFATTCSGRADHRCI